MNPKPRTTRYPRARGKRREWFMGEGVTRDSEQTLSNTRGCHGTRSQRWEASGSIPATLLHGDQHVPVEPLKAAYKSFRPDAY